MGYAFRNLSESILGMATFGTFILSAVLVVDVILTDEIKISNTSWIKEMPKKN